MMKPISRFFCCVIAISLAVIAHQSIAQEYHLPPSNSHLVGEMKSYVVPNDGRSLEAIAAKYEVGLLALMSANPGVDPLLPKAGSSLVIPSMALLPNYPREGIIINLAELRLYYFPKDKSSVFIFPIGIGQLGRETPVMVTKIIEKKANPTWTPTANIRKDYASRGITLPAVVPGGPDNPMGLFALRLAAGGGTYLIHGTNANFGIGLRVSSGCIRLRPNDIEFLFNIVPIGTPVRVIDEPFKFAIEPDGKHYIEVHQPLSKKEGDNPQVLPIHLNESAQHFINAPQNNYPLAVSEIKQRRGYPINITQ